MNHAIKRDIEERDQMAAYIQKAIDALNEALKFDKELEEKNLVGLNTLGMCERPVIIRHMNLLKEAKETYIKRRKWEDDQ